jgi:hypothetical protein
MRGRKGEGGDLRHNVLPHRFSFRPAFFQANGPLKGIFGGA